MFLALSVFLLFFYIFNFPNKAAGILTSNSGFISIFIVLVLFPFTWLWSFMYLMGRKIRTEISLAVLGIAAALLLFIYQNYSDTLSKIVVLQHTSFLNCNLATSLASSMPGRLQYPEPHLDADVYKQNLSFLSSDYSQSTLYAAQDDIAQIDVLNSYIDLGTQFTLQQATNSAQKRILDQQLINQANIVETTTCNKINPNLFESTQEYTRASFWSVISDLFSNFF